MKLPIPVNIITGALGVGKTTVVQHILSNKPRAERWALLVNEFGALGIDAALVEASLGASMSSGPAAVSSGSGSSVVVRELAGGCLCCTLSGPLGVAIAQLVRQAKPDRLIIEPSGLGHPAGLLDTLYGEHLRTALDVHAVICLVDVRQVAEMEGAALAAGAAAAVPAETFQDQINVADVLVGHKADVASPDQQAAFWRWAEGLYPPKAQVLLTSHGRIALDLLDLPRAPVFRPIFRPMGHSSRRRATQRATKRAPALMENGRAAVPQPGGPGGGATIAGEGGGSLHGGTGDAGTREAALADGELLEGNGGEAEEEEEADNEDTAPDGAVDLSALAPRRPLRFPSGPTTTNQAADPSSQPEPLPAQECGRQPEAAVSSSFEAPYSDPGWAPQPGARVSCGWLFSPEDVFDRGRLTEVLRAVWPRVLRLKGIFRVGKSSYVVPYLTPQGAVELRPVSYRRESRLEMIVGWGPDAADARRGMEAVARGVRQLGITGDLAPEQAAGPTGSDIVTAGAEMDGGSAAAKLAGACLGGAAASADWDAVERELMAAIR